MNIYVLIFIYLFCYSDCLKGNKDHEWQKASKWCAGALPDITVDNHLAFKGKTQEVKWHKIVFHEFIIFKPKFYVFKWNSCLNFLIQKPVDLSTLFFRLEGNKLHGKRIGKKIMKSYI